MQIFPCSGINCGKALHGGTVLELAGLKAPLKTGETVPLTLNIELADKRIVNIDVQAEIKPLKSATQK